MQYYNVGLLTKSYGCGVSMSSRKEQKLNYKLLYINIQKRKRKSIILIIYISHIPKYNVITYIKKFLNFTQSM